MEQILIEAKAGTDNKYTISVSTIAIEQIKKQLEKRGTPTAYLRFGLKGAGCNGYLTVFQFEDSVNLRDLTFSFGDVKLLIDPKSIVLLTGSTIDWEQQLLKQGFKVSSPLQKSSCGCGKSASF